MNFDLAATYESERDWTLDFRDARLRAADEMRAWDARITEIQKRFGAREPTRAEQSSLRGLATMCGRLHR